MRLFKTFLIAFCTLCLSSCTYYNVSILGDSEGQIEQSKTADVDTDAQVPVSALP